MAIYYHVSLRASLKHMYAHAHMDAKLMRFNRIKSTLIEFKSHFNRLFRLDSSGRINRRDESDSKSRSKTKRFRSEFESNSNLYQKWSNLIIIVNLYRRFRYKLTFPI